MKDYTYKSLHTVQQSCRMLSWCGMKVASLLCHTQLSMLHEEKREGLVHVTT